jgi:hypothetical protein
LCQQWSVEGWESTFKSILLRVRTVRCIHLSPPATTKIFRSQFQFHSEAGVKHIGWFLWRATTVSCLPQALAHSRQQRHGQRSRRW